MHSITNWRASADVGGAATRGARSQGPSCDCAGPCAAPRSCRRRTCGVCDRVEARAARDSAAATRRWFWVARRDSPAAMEERPARTRRASVLHRLRAPPCASTRRATSVSRFRRALTGARQSSDSPPSAYSSPAKAHPRDGQGQQILRSVAANVSRDHAVLHCQNHLHDAGDARGRLQMADI